MAVYILIFNVHCVQLPFTRPLTLILLSLPSAGVWSWFYQRRSLEPKLNVTFFTCTRTRRGLDLDGNRKKLGIEVVEWRAKLWRMWGMWKHLPSTPKVFSFPVFSSSSREQSAAQAVSNSMWQKLWVESKLYFYLCRYITDVQDSTWYAECYFEFERNNFLLRTDCPITSHPSWPIKSVQHTQLEAQYFPACTVYI